MENATQNRNLLTPKTIKLVAVGDGGVGKTTYFKKLLNGNFDPEYVATLGVEVHPISIESIPGVNFNVWDCAGQEKFTGVGDGYFCGADACLAFFDPRSRFSFKNLSNWLRAYSRMVNNNNIVIVATNLELESERRITRSEIEELGYPFVEISTKNGTNLEIPFQEIAKFF